MKFNALLLMALLCFAISANAQEISDTKFGKGMINFVAKDSSFSVKFAPRFQFNSYTSWQHEDGKYQTGFNNMLIRRARLKFDGFAVTPKLRYKLELGLSNRDISGADAFNNNTPRYVMDAVIMWNFFENFELWVGQTKLPGNIERVVSSGNLSLVDRSILNSRFNIDRDVGFQIRHLTRIGKTMVTREKFSFSQGEGRNQTVGNLGGHQYTARVEFLPFGLFESGGDYVEADLKREPTPKLMFAAGFNINTDAVRVRGNQGAYMITDQGYHQTDVSAIFIDAMFKYRGFSLMAEYADRTADDPIARDSDGTPTGFVVLEGSSVNFHAGYALKSNYEFVGRFTTVDYDEVVGGGSETQYTFGINKYFVGHKLKVQTDFTYGERDNLKDFLMWRLGFDLHF